MSKFMFKELIYTRKICALLLCILLLPLGLSGCGEKKTPKIGVAFGVGPATRWAKEIQYMNDYAKELDVKIEARLNTDEKEKSLAQDCFELIDSGIDVLIVRPRNVHGMKEVVDYAHKNSVKIISYDSVIENENIDLFIGYDSEYVGQILAQYLSEAAPKGDYIFVWGDSNRNIEDMRRGAMKHLSPNQDQINIVTEATIPGWSVEETKKIIKKTISANGNKVDAIFAFNDKLAGACAEACAELGVTNPVVIAGMDAELAAIKRIVAGTQSCTAYMDLKDLARSTIDHAINLAKGQKGEINSHTDNGSDTPVPSYLLARKLVTKQNINRILIQSGYYTKEQVYGIEPH